MEDDEIPPICQPFTSRQLFDPGKTAREEGDVKTQLWAQAKVYLQARIQRQELQAKSAVMPRRALREFCTSFGNRPIAQLGEPAVLRWMESTAHKAPGTRRNEFSAVKGFCRWLVREGKLRRDPTIGIARIKQPRKVVHTVNRGEVDALWAACDGPRDRAIVALMFILGLRCIDAARLDVDSWDRYSNVLLVKGKGGHERELPVVPHVATALREWIAVEPRNSGPLFPSSSGRLKPATISWRVSILMYRAQIKDGPFDGKSAHALRRTAATETLEASHNIRAVQALLGHADLSSMRHYIARTDVAKIADAVQSRFDAA